MNAWLYSNKTLLQKQEVGYIWATSCILLLPIREDRVSLKNMLHFPNVAIACLCIRVCTQVVLDVQTTPLDGAFTEIVNGLKIPLPTFSRKQNNVGF